VFPEATLARIAVIDLVRRAGLRLEEIRELLEPGPGAPGPGARWQALAAPKLAELQQVLAAVHAMRRLLNHLVSCHCASLEECADKAAEHSTAQYG
jgi:DNA-binding transcriptional MerR regulator